MGNSFSSKAVDASTSPATASEKPEGKLVKWGSWTWSCIKHPVDSTVSGAKSVKNFYWNCSVRSRVTKIGLTAILAFVAVLLTCCKKTRKTIFTAVANHIPHKAHKSAVSLK